MTEDIQRLNYYEKQYLGASDMQAEQAYHIEMRRRHNIGPHTWGIVTGLEVTQDSASKVVSVQPGLAIDGYGREIVVPAAEPLDSQEIAAQLAGAVNPTDLKVWIAYRLIKTDQPRPGYEVCDQLEQFTRQSETFRLIYQDDPPTGDPANPPKPSDDLPDDPTGSAWPVFLCTITYDPASRQISAINPAGRQYAGLVGAEISPPAPAQATPPGAVPVPANLTLRADETHLTGMQAGETGHVTADGDLQLNGGKLDLRTAGGLESGAPLHVLRDGVKDLRLQLGDDPSQGARLVVGAGSEVKLALGADGSLQVDGSLTLQNQKDLSLQGGKLAFQNADGTTAPDETEISRKQNNLGHTDLQVGLGTAASPGARLVVGPKQGADVDAKFIVENDGDVTVGNSLVVQGFTLYHRGADLVISRRTGGNPRALVDWINQTLVINFNGDYSGGTEVQSDLNVVGDISLTGRVDGRDVAADGAKLDAIALGGNVVTVRQGVITDGGTIPLPAGYTQPQCRWIVSPNTYDPGFFDINENGANARFELECFTNSSRVVTVKWYQQGHASTPGFVAHSGTANYLIIGVK